MKDMLYKKNLCTLLAFVLLASQAAAQQGTSKPRTVESARLRTHVTYLASDKLEGRRTGSTGAQEAARYVAREFMRARVLPGAPVNCNELNETCYMQQFPYVAGVELGKGNTLRS